jgi:hypothetical protein
VFLASILGEMPGGRMAGETQRKERYTGKQKGERR